jgi:NAD(P)H-hydrate epimerase
VLVIAGSRQMPGAAVLCSEAAMSAGAGLVTLAAPESVFRQLPLMPEIIRLPLPDAEALGSASVSVIQEALSGGKYNAVVIGPGLGQASETVETVRSLLAWLTEWEWPVVADADALNALSREPLTLTSQCILTPHIGECSRLLRQDKTAILADVLQAARQAQERYQAQVVLKSAATVIATQASGQAQSLCWISPTGNPGMATAGSGDVLTGIIGALAAQLHAQSKPVWQAALLGVFLHGLAGDAAATALTSYAMRASDITRHLPQAFKAILQP